MSQVGVRVLQKTFGQDLLHESRDVFLDLVVGRPTPPVLNRFRFSRNPVVAGLGLRVNSGNDLFLDLARPGLEVLAELEIGRLEVVRNGLKSQTAS